VQLCGDKTDGCASYQVCPPGYEVSRGSEDHFLLFDHLLTFFLFFRPFVCDFCERAFPQVCSPLQVFHRTGELKRANIESFFGYSQE